MISDQPVNLDNKQRQVLLGQLVRQMRERKKMSQFDLGLCMGWSGAAPVSKIERGLRMPEPPTIERLSFCLGLSYADEFYLRSLAGHIPQTRMPKAAQIISVLEEVADEISLWPYPAYVLDYQHIVWSFNSVIVALVGTLGYSLEDMRGMLRSRFTDIDSFWDGNQRFTTLLADPIFREEKVLRFQLTNLFRRAEPFYLAYPERMRYLPPEDYAHFVACWRRTEEHLATATRPERLRPGIVLGSPSGPQIEFTIQTQPIEHLGNLFHVVWFHPNNPIPTEASIDGQLYKTINLWEIDHIDDRALAFWPRFSQENTSSQCQIGRAHV